MAKRNKLEIIKDILERIKFSHNEIKFTPLLRKSNLSSSRFSEYFNELLKKGFVKKIKNPKGNFVILTEKGYQYLEKYQNIIGFIEEFEL